MKCSFCDRDFHIDQAEIACGSCPIAKGCHLIRCPYCGYEMPPEPRLVGRLRWLRDRIRNGNGHNADALIQVETIGAVAALSDMQPGQSGEIFELSLEESSVVQKLVAMNLLPGVEIRLLRRSPSFVFESGFSQFAVDEGIASLIQVRITAPQISELSSPAK
jgi:DtxR family Mn-dependent transcriptional regulator/ferrous iron transport protein A